jgi:hypothetical protein
MSTSDRDEGEEEEGEQRAEIPVGLMKLFLGEVVYAVTP